MHRIFLVSLLIGMILTGCSSEPPSPTLKGLPIVDADGWKSFATISEPIGDLNFLSISDGSFVVLAVKQDVILKYKLDKDGKVVSDEQVMIVDQNYRTPFLYNEYVKIYSDDSAIYSYYDKNIYKNSEIIASLSESVLPINVDFDESKNILLGGSLYYQIATNTWKNLSQLKLNGYEEGFIDDQNANHLYLVSVLGGTTRDGRKVEVKEADLNAMTLTDPKEVLFRVADDESSIKFTQDTKDKIYLFYVREVDYPAIKYFLNIITYDKNSKSLEIIGQNIPLPYNEVTDDNGSIIRDLGRFDVTQDNKIFYSLYLSNTYFPSDLEDGEKTFGIFQFDGNSKFFDVTPQITGGTFEDGGIVEFNRAWAYGNYLYGIFRKTCRCDGENESIVQIARIQ
jgi:hypothetical protein